jgi:peptide/nickel transport system substrate-binding protein
MEMRPFGNSLHRVSRRSVLAGSAGALAAFAIDACSSGGSSASSQAGSKLTGPAAQGALRWDTAVFPADLNPIGSQNAAPNKRLMVWVSNALLRPTNQPNVYTPDLAVSLPQPQPDLLSWQFTLKPNARWSDGSPCTAHDVVATFEAIKNPNSGSIWQSALINVASADALNDSTVRFTMSEPDTGILNGFASVPIVKASEASDVDKLSTNPTGTGPFKISSVSSGQQITMVPNTYYFSSGLPRVKQLQYVLDSDDSLLVINLEKGITALTSDMSYGDVAGLQRQGVKVYVDPGAPTRTYMNVGPQFTDQNFRQAIAYAINRQQVVEDVYFGYAKPGQGQYSPNTYGYDPSITMFSASADVAKAKQLLAKANYPKSTLMITVPSAPRLNATAAILQANWQAIGLNVQVESLQIGAAVAKLVSGKFDFFLYEDFLGTGPGFTPNYIYTTLATKSPGNSADISVPAVDAAIKVASTTPNKSEQLAALKFLQQWDIENAWWLGICYPYYLEAQGVPLTGYSPTRLGNVPLEVEDAKIA